MGQEIDLMVNYPRAKRDVKARVKERPPLTKRLPGNSAVTSLMATVATDMVVLL